MPNWAPKKVPVEKLVAQTQSSPARLLTDYNLYSKNYLNFNQEDARKLISQKLRSNSTNNKFLAVLRFWNSL